MCCAIAALFSASATSLAAPFATGTTVFVALGAWLVSVRLPYEGGKPLEIGEVLRASAITVLVSPRNPCVGPWYTSEPPIDDDQPVAPARASLRMCEETSTVRSPLPIERMNSRISLIPAGSRPLVGSSRTSSGVPEQSGGDTQALLHAERVVAEPVRASPAESDEVEHLGNAARVVAAQVARTRRFSMPLARPEGGCSISAPTRSR